MDKWVYTFFVVDKHLHQEKKVVACGFKWVVYWWQWVRVVNQNSLPPKNKNHCKLKQPKGPMGKVDYFERKLDDKRRLTIPTELRGELSSGVVLTRGFGKYLHLYPKKVWDDMVEPKLDGDILDERIADLNVQFRTGKTELALDDKQGRVTIETHLLAYAGIDKDVAVVSVGRYWRVMAK